MQQFDAARDAYQLALQADAPALDATAQLKVRHNLGRLEIAAGNYEAAIAPLLAGLELLETAPVARELAAATQRDFRYQLQTNLGWAQEGLGNLDVAASLLAEAIALYPEGATAHCLAGKAAEAQGQRAAALAAWNNCRTYADRRDPEQYRWWSLARQRLSELAAGS